MNSEERLSALCSVLIERLVRSEARAEVILKTQAHFLGTVAKQDWREIYEDLEKDLRVREQQLHAETLRELKQFLPRKS